MKQNPDLISLLSKYPRLYASLRSMDCSSGWYDILDRLSFKLEKMIEAGQWEIGEGPCAAQVKEKYGTLRFYMHTETDEMSEAIAEAEAESSKVCERCGETGKVRQYGWIYTLCDECEAIMVKEHQAFWNRVEKVKKE